MYVLAMAFQRPSNSFTEMCSVQRCCRTSQARQRAMRIWGHCMQRVWLDVCFCRIVHAMTMPELQLRAPARNASEIIPPMSVGLAENMSLAYIDMHKYVRKERRSLSDRSGIIIHNRQYYKLTILIRIFNGVRWPVLAGSNRSAFGYGATSVFLLCRTNRS